MSLFRREICPNADKTTVVTIEDLALWIKQTDIDGDVHECLFIEEEIDELLATIQAAQKHLSAVLHAAQGEPASAPQDKAHETPGRQSFLREYRQVVARNGLLVIRSERQAFVFHNPELLAFEGSKFNVSFNPDRPRQDVLAFLDHAGNWEDSTPILCSCLDAKVALPPSEEAP